MWKEEGGETSASISPSPPLPLPPLIPSYLASSPSLLLTVYTSFQCYRVSRSVRCYIRVIVLAFLCIVMPIPPGVCFICRGTLEEGTVIIVKKRGIISLINASVKRGLQENKSFLQKLEEVTVHDACRKRYTVESNVEASVRRGGDSVPQACNQPSLRSSSVHNLKTICFLCGEDITEEYIKLQQKLPYSRRNNVHKVEKLGVRATVLEAAERRDDEWGKNIIQRLASENDLVAADARYHNLCYKKLFNNPSTSGQKRGYRPASEVEEAMECIYSYLSENSDECQFSLDELLKTIKGPYLPDIRTVKSHLNKKFGDDIIITDLGSCKGAIVCYKNIGHKILYDKWYEERKSDVQQERLRVVKAAAEIIVEDIRSQVYDNSEYPPSDNFLGSHEAIAKAGEKCFVALYGGDFKKDTLNSLRYQLFVKCAANAKINLARLPPTEEAASHHSYRTYHQVQKWLGTNKSPTEWGWKLDDQGIIPVTATTDPAPALLLRMISCKCKKGCSGGCSCRKLGLKCSALCKFCAGKSCQNVPSLQLGNIIMLIFEKKS